MSYASKTCVVVCAMVAMLALAPQAQATLIACYNMEQSASPLVDQAGGQTAVTNGGGGDLYQQAGVPAGTYGALTTLSTGYAAGLSNTASQWDISVADSAELNLTNNFTVMGWLYLPASPGATVPSLIGRGQGWAGRGWNFAVRDYQAGSRGIELTGNGIADYYSNDVITWDQWHHIAATKSSTGGINFYLDGNLTATIAGATGNFNALSGTESYSLGRGNTIATQAINGGKMDELRVYNTVLTQTEIRAAAVVVPEPSTIVLAASGLIGLLAYAWRKRK